MKKRKNGKSIRQVGRDWAAKQPTPIRIAFGRLKPWHVYRVVGGPTLACVIGFARMEGQAEAWPRVSAYGSDGDNVVSYVSPRKLVRIHGSAMEFHDAAYRRRLLMGAISRDAARFGMIPKGTKLTEDMVFSHDETQLTTTPQEGADNAV
jgi:hypothetical protein